MDKTSKKLKSEYSPTDNSIVQSNRSGPSRFSHDNSILQSNKSGSNQNADSVAVNANTDNTEFVNNALILWTEMRQQWVENRPRKKARKLGERVLSSNTSYESLLETKTPFSRRIPLPEMIEFLVKVWKEEGLYEKA